MGGPWIQEGLMVQKPDEGGHGSERVEGSDEDSVEGSEQRPLTPEELKEQAEKQRMSVEEHLAGLWCVLGLGD
jgi:hypothetical protein